MPLKIKPLVRQPKLTQTEARRRAYVAAERVCGTLSQHLTIKSAAWREKKARTTP